MIFIIKDNKFDMNRLVKHNLNESYLQSLTEEERVRQMSEWTSSEWQEYYCPEGVISLDDAMDYLKNKALKIVEDKYGDCI